MRLEQLHYLLVTANCHSMHKASEILHVSQQNISKAIRDLEKEFHLKLFHAQLFCKIHKKKSLTHPLSALRS